MKAIVYDRPGGPDVLRWIDVPDPICEPDTMILRVAASAIEGGDLVQRRSMVPDAEGPTLGYAATGTIERVGTSVSGFRPGQRVATVVMKGAHAERVVCDPRATWALPDDMEFVTAAVIPISYGTAHECLARAGHVGGCTILIQGGAGGLGIALVQLASRAGARVLATVSGERRVSALRPLGLDSPIDHRCQDVAETVRELTAGAMADVVVDPIGGTTLAVSLAALRPHGDLVFVGNAGGLSLEVDLWPALRANQTLHGVFLGTEFAKPSVHTAVADIIASVAARDLPVAIDRTFDLSAAAEAHRYVEAGDQFGRVVLIHSGLN